MDQGDALDYPMLHEKALAEIERLRAHKTVLEEEVERLHKIYGAENGRLQGLLWQEAGNRIKIERLRDALEQAVDDFGEGHCVCEQTKQQCIDALKEGE
jgi:hypothetical protein